ncbi:glycosyltransferase [Pseudomonas laurylsulfatiphila]|uniref:glycosyltransferase n=1 Tax=Pseudomonas laurylsulfatiphila TaxID=2011015 RepID=UPI003D1A82DF
MDNKKRSGTAVILYFGVGIETTPKLALIKQTLEKQYEKVLIAGITATHYSSTEPHKVIAVSDKHKPLKILKSVTGLLKLCLWLNKTSPQLIYAVNPIPGLIATIFKKLKSIEYIYETLEIFCGLDYFPYNKRYRSIWYFLEKKTINNSLKSFTTDEFREKFLRRLLKTNKDKITYTYNTNSQAHILPEHIKNQPMILSYCGGVYPGREIDEVIRAFALLKKSTPNIRLIIAGGGNARYIQELTQLSRDLEITSCVEFTGSLPNNQLKKIMNESKITFAFYKRDSINNRLNSPNKIFDAIFCRTLLLTTNSPLSRKVIQSNNIGNLIKETSAIEISKKCHELLNNRESQSQFNELIDKYSWETEERKILKALGSTLQ